MIGRRAFVAASLLALLAGCTAHGDTGENSAQADAVPPDTPVSSDDPLPSAPQPTGPTGDCPISGSSDWAAWVNAMPGPAARPQLIVIGKVVVPSGGYRVSLQTGPVLELYPPIQQVELKAVPPPREGPPIVQTFDVRATLPALPEYGEVQVRCGNRTLTTIRDIVRAS